MEIGEAIREVRGERTQKELVALIDRSETDHEIGQDTLSRFERGDPSRIPTPRDIAAIERAAGAELGTVLVLAGYVEGVPSVELSIAADPRLDEELRSTLLTSYRAILALATHRRSQGPS